MPFDGIALAAMTRELSDALCGGRIEKVLQPERDEIHLLIRNRFETHRLLISTSARYARVHLSGEAKANPLKLPVFCAMLRKHLSGGRILEIRQAGLERILEIYISAYDELGGETSLILRSELMGRHSNLILCQAQGRILDSIKRITEEKSRVREVLPGLRYEYPPSQNKLDPMQSSAEDIARALEDQESSGADALFGALVGFSPWTAGEFVNACLPACAWGSEERMTLAKLVKDRLEAIGRGEISPCILLDGHREADFYPLHPAALPEGFTTLSTPTFSEAVERFYASRDKADHLRQRSAGITQVVQNALQRAQRKYEKQRLDLLAAADGDSYRLMGELLTANLHSLKKGMTEVRLTDYYTDDLREITIPLNIRMTPAENAQAYYKKYAKAKATLAQLKQFFEQSAEEIAYLEGQLVNIAQCQSNGDVEEIHRELVQQGYIREARASGAKSPPASKPLHFRSVDGLDLYVGRNNIQNDALTLRFARPDDLWLHTKDIPGSHVILRCDGTPPESSVLQAALLAAYYSKARTSSQVPVDYTQKRYVKKPSGARPGFVIYTDQHTLYVTPEEELVSAIPKV